MKYENEKMFVENFAKDVKNETSFEVNGKEFSAEYVGKNSGQQAVYKVTLDGNTKEMNITQLKKRLGVTYTREQNRTGECKATTKFVEKTEDELRTTAKRVVEKAAKAVEVLDAIANEYAIVWENVVAGGYTDYNNNDDGEWISLETLILSELQDRQKRALHEKQDRQKKAAKEKAAKQAETIKLLLAQGMDKDELRALLGL